MSKELTEKWKNKELVGGWYFLEFENGSIFPVYYCGFNREFEFGWDWKISEVLDRCDYKELKKLKKERNALAMGSFPLMIEAAKKMDLLRQQLDIAIKSINSAAGYLACMDDLSEVSGKCNEQMALEELNKAIEQIKELEK